MPRAGSQDSTRITLTTANTLTIRGRIEPEAVQTWQLALDALIEKRGTKTYPIYIVLDSPGGSVEAGFTFIDYVKHYENIHTITLWSASMAAVIVEHLPGKRYILHNGTMLFHKIRMALQGYFQAWQLARIAAGLASAEHFVEEAIIQRSGMDRAKFEQMMIDETEYTSDTAIKEHLADEEVEIICTKQLTKQRTTTIVSMGLFGELKIVQSGCPLIREPLKN